MRGSGSIILLSAPHEIDVFNGNVAAITEISNEDSQSDRGFSRRNCQNQHGKDLSGDVAVKCGKRDQVDVHREQQKLDRHQNDDDVLPVHENAEDTNREKRCGEREVMSQS